MVTVTLSGNLGNVVGRPVWNLLVNTVGEAVRAIEAQTGRLYSYLRSREQEGVEYRVIINGKDHKELSDLITPSDRLRSVEIVAVPAGSGGGFWQLLLGIVLIIVGVVLYAFGGAALAQVGIAIALAGISTTLGGIAQMLAKSPTISPTDPKTQDFQPNASYLFSSATNTARQGNIVPLGYGRMIVGSQLISFGIHSYSLGPSGYLPIPIPETNTSIPAYLSLSFWGRTYPLGFVDDPRRAYVLTDNRIESYPTQSLYDAVDAFDLRAVSGHPNATYEDLREMLKVCSRLFIFHSSITYLQAKALYNWIGLTGVTANGATIIDYIRALVGYYLPDANTND